jgi:hypothetical protein
VMPAAVSDVRHSIVTVISNSGLNERRGSPGIAKGPGPEAEVQSLENAPQFWSHVRSERGE